MDLTGIENLELPRETFNNMKKLRFLKIYALYAWEREGKIIVPTTGMESISSKISYFHWEGYPGKSLPINFCAKLLLELNLKCSCHVETLWKGVQVLFINFKFII